MTMIIHKKYLPDVDIDTSSFIYEDDCILIQDEYICDVLKCMNVPEVNVDQYHELCYNRCFIDYPQVLEYYALKSARNVYSYAILVLKGRFELGEPSIATNAEYSYYYAKHILKGRFELGEKAIATDAEHSHWYAKHVVKGRFELGEHAILDSNYADKYRELFL